MKSQQIEHIQSTEPFVRGILFICGAIGLSYLYRNLLPATIISLFQAALLLVLAGYVWRRYQPIRLFKIHLDNLRAAGKTVGWKVSISTTGKVRVSSTFAHMSLRLLAPDKQRFHSYVDGKGWEYADWSYDVYRSTRSGVYKDSEVYYGVMAAKLSRKMPNVFFDSKSARTRQFKAKFEANQKHSLEGNFDQYFDSYFPETYTIDSYSFITPDVMEALIAVSDYDVEIVQDSILLYGPVYAENAKIDKMARILGELQAQFEHQAKTYRDDRLPIGENAKTVTPLGIKLKPTQIPLPAWWAYGVVVLAYVIYVVMVNRN